MHQETPPSKVASNDQLGHADETHAARAVLDTDDIEVLREALAVAWGDLMTAQLKCNDQAAEIERLKDTYSAVQAENADLSTERRHHLQEIESLNFQRQMLQSEADRLRSRIARLRAEVTRELISQGWTAPKA